MPGGIMLAANWPDLQEVDFRKIYLNRYAEIPMMVPDLYAVATSSQAFAE